MQLSFRHSLALIGGSAILSLGIVSFLSPNQIATGGTAGIAIVLHHLLSLPIGILIALINFPLLLLSVKYLGKRFAVRTILAILLISFFVDFFSSVLHLPALSNHLLLATLYGGILTGIGIGLIFQGGASAGGGTILAKIVAQHSSLREGTVILLLDGIVILSTAITFKSTELALWSMISIYATSRMVDMMLTGHSHEKIVHIATSKDPYLLCKILWDQLHVGGTLVQGQSTQTENHRNIIFATIEKNKLNAVKQIVKNYDPQARMIVMEAVELLGPPASLA